jgi:hypothetical protein
MWFLFQHPDEFMDRFNAERQRVERIAQLTRAMRGATPPFDATTRQRLQRALAEPTHDLSRHGRLAGGRS